MVISYNQNNTEGYYQSSSSGFWKYLLNELKKELK